VPSLAAHTSSATAQRLLLALQDPDINLELATNPRLDPEIWLALLPLTTLPNGRPDIFSNAPNSELASKILQEPPEVRIAALRLGIPNLDLSSLQKLLAPPLLDYKHASASILSATAPTHLLPSLWQVLATHPTTLRTDYYTTQLLNSLALNYDFLKDSDLLEIIVDDSWTSKNIPQLLDLRPALTELLYQHPSSAHFLPEITASRYLTPEQATQIYNKLTSPNLRADRRISERSKKLAPLYIGSNPSLPHALRIKALTFTMPFLRNDLYKSIRAELSPRYLQREINLLRQRSDQGLPPITDWLNVAEDRKVEVYDAIGFFGPENYPTIKNSKRFYTQYVGELNQRFIDGIPELEAAGAQAWDIFISLLDDWHDSLQELLQLAISTAIK